jgi:hypothetical protein
MKTHCRIKILCLAFLAALCAVVSAQDESDVWKPFQFMIGDWSGGGSGKPGEGVGQFSVAFELNRKILVRRNHAEYPAKPGQAKGPAHDDLMVIYPQAGQGGFRAEYFDSEGHVIHYAVSFPAGKIVFESDNSSGGPRFKLIYEMKSADDLGLEFDVAPPNRDYQPYLTGTVHRKSTN